MNEPLVAVELGLVIIDNVNEMVSPAVTYDAWEITTSVIVRILVEET